jgi:cyclopropane-fatty-acyl-phospholipid synthase
MWRSAFDLMLRQLLHIGSLRVVFPNGDDRDYGDGSGARLGVHIHDNATVRHLALNPELALGESYMNGTLTIEDDDVHRLLALIVRNQHDATRVWWQRIKVQARLSMRRMSQNNVAVRSRRNVAHHYDLSDTLYDLFLDADRQYSCGYFENPSDTLEQAQENKKHHIARKLLLEPDSRVLDIGCGWGGMALTLARDYGAKVVGVTLSEQQHDYATKSAARAGLSQRVEFRLCDYRDLTETFDRVVSVGMFEHVGLPHFNTYFKAIHDRLSPDGIALIHTIGWTGTPDATNPWIAKYIFPGGYVPTMSEVMPAIEASSLWTADVECLRLHYAYTLRHWFDRFEANKDKVRALYDDRFVRMWRFYLAACELTFRHGHQAVFQCQISRRIDAVPVTRDYLYPSSAIHPTSALHAISGHNQRLTDRKTVALRQS